MKNILKYNKIMLVEDDQDFQEVISDYLKQLIDKKIIIQRTDSCIEALLKLAISNGEYDLLIIDHRLKGRPDGFFLCKEVARKYPWVSMIMLSGISVDEFVLLSKKQKYAPKFMSKPFSCVEFETILCDLLLEKRNLAA
jgi:DNA-binding NtrC family response regulator